jgi:hypothetical protein
MKKIRCKTIGKEGKGTNSDEKIINRRIKLDNCKEILVKERNNIKT